MYCGRESAYAPVYIISSIPSLITLAHVLIHSFRPASDTLIIELLSYALVASDINSCGSMLPQTSHNLNSALASYSHSVSPAPLSPVGKMSHSQRTISQDSSSDSIRKRVCKACDSTSFPTNTLSAAASETIWLWHAC